MVLNNFKILTFLIFIINISFLVNASQLKGTHFDRIITIVLGNSNYEESMKDPYLLYLANQGMLLSNYHGVWHPSQPNYIAMIRASKSGVLTDFNQDVEGASLPDLLEEKGISWKAYMENYPGNGFSESHSDDKLYVRKHNPFISMNQIRTNSSRYIYIVNADRLKKDIEDGTVPQYVFYSPNMVNSGHDTDLSYAIITFDESSKYLDSLTNYNHIYTVLIGPNVLKSMKHEDNGWYSHYSFVPTIEQNWNLSALGTGDDAESTPFDNEK
ncbi:13087_t:CDS:2 [Dentiscutata heterogama]|uniref:13087_t:CDS:1 n=1 Tax=Dentiscutata heterogama TaxID=1316150 RepID=A0ACA9KGR7_9GLOM|nr:13087_t:CDS:2 [Dentiscutata heterogama]